MDFRTVDPDAARFYAQPSKQRAIRRILRVYPLIEWGGEWRMRDYMHFQLRTGTTVRAVEPLIHHLGIQPAGVRTSTRFGTRLRRST